MKTIGRISAKLISRLYDDGLTSFNIKTARSILGKKYNEITDLLSRMAERKLIARLKSGKYLLIPFELGNADNYIGNWYVAAREIINSKDYYVGFYSAMHYWGMLTQPPVRIFVATPKRQVVPAGMKNRLVIVTVKKKFIWGVEEVRVSGGEKVRISDREKTVIDSLRLPEYCGGISEAVKGIWLIKDKLDYARLKNYAGICGSNVVAKRLGYILETLELGSPSFLAVLRKYVKDKYDIFDPSLPAESVEGNSWRLIDNVGKKTLLSLIRS